MMMAMIMMMKMLAFSLSHIRRRSHQTELLTNVATDMRDVCAQAYRAEKVN